MRTSTFATSTLALAVATLASCLCSATAGAGEGSAAGAASEPFLLAPPRDGGPVVVQAHFELRAINEINDGSETFEFSGLLTTRWRDPRQGFDPAVAGVDEKIYQGTFQFDEISPGWFPQMILVNESGLYEKSGVVLRVRPDGTSVLIEAINAVAETDFHLGRFPFDHHRLEAVFEVLGFDRSEVRLEVEPASAQLPVGKLQLPQWTTEGVSLVEREHRSIDPSGGATSTLVVSADVKRRAWYSVRLVILPLLLIVLLSFSVFWMDRSSLGDRINVSFIGILTAVAYQLVVSELLPRISEMTWIHGFLSFSFLTLCATVVANLVVGDLDKRGLTSLGDRVDRCCRWAFPLGYAVLLLVLFVFTASVL